MTFLEQRRRLSLALADGSTWEISAADERAAPVLSGLAEGMGLASAAKSLPPSARVSSRRSVRRLVVSVDGDRGAWTGLPPDTDGTVTCVVCLEHELDLLSVQLQRITNVLGAHVVSQGGLLLHSALAEIEEQGVILVGPSGAGKTTASERLPAPWRALSDDRTLLVRDRLGRFWAHPWPAWSLFHKFGATWRVQEPVLLRGIFFLEPAQEDRVDFVRNGQAAVMLLQGAERVGERVTEDMPQELVRQIRLRRFENASLLAQAVPSHRLYLSLTGAFWMEMERVLYRERSGYSHNESQVCSGRAR